MIQPHKVVVVADYEASGLIHKLVKGASEGRNVQVTVKEYSGAGYKQAEVLHDVSMMKGVELIVCTGSSVLAHFIAGKEKDSAARLRENDQMVWQGIPVRMTYSPKYVDKRGGETTREFELVLSDLKGFFDFGEDAVKNFTYDTYEPKDYLRFLSKFADATDLALDYEGSSLEPTIEGFECGGIGLARPGYAAYLCFKDFGDLEYKLTPEIADKVGRFLKAKDAQIRARQEAGAVAGAEGCTLVFNAKYELPLSHSVFGQRLENITDVMQECRTLDVSGGLKEISKRWLGVQGWTKDLDEWREVFGGLLLQLKPTAKNERKEAVEFKKAWYDGYSGVEAIMAGLWSRKTNSRAQAIADLIARCLELARAHYGDRAERKVNEYISYKLTKKDYECNYTEVPKEIVGPYCGDDCHYTLDVHYIARKQLEDLNLLPAASYYNKQIYLGSAMENNGIFWDDSVAVRVEEQHSGVMIEALREFLLCPAVRSGLQFKREGATDEEERARIGDQDVIEIQSATTIDKLKRYFNPEASFPENTAMLGRLIVTPTIRVCLMLHEVNKAFQFSVQEASGMYPNLVPVLRKILLSKDRGAHTVQGFVRAFRTIKDAGRLNYYEEELYGKFAAYSLPSAEGEVIQELMDALILFTGCDLDKRESWVPDVYPLYYYKLFKKVTKAISAFINGKGGRKSVDIAKFDPATGDYKRLANYFDRPKGEDEVYIYGPAYGVNMAKTKRWTSAYHGIASMSESREAFVSRHKGGIMTKCDFSQHELRIIASVCKDPNMIQAFVENRDLHKMVASLLYNVPEDQITDNQRAVAKAANFGLVYLKTPETFAVEYLSGDVNEANRVFNAVFTLFPGLKAWRDGCIRGLHQTIAKTTGDFVRFPIYTLWGDPIWHEFNKTKRMEVIDAERYSVNWVIQSTASNLAALAEAETARFFAEGKYHTVPFGFTHDCEEFDTHPHEFMLMLEKIPEISEEYLFREFSLPVKIDVEIGVNLGSLVEFKRPKGQTKYIADGVARGVFDGGAADVDALIAQLRQTHVVTVEDEKVKEKFNSSSILFSKKGCYYSSIGQKSVSKSCTVTITPAYA